jgi:uncharacterized SAM-binding protein YcdF (DUF218 family)
MIQVLTDRLRPFVERVWNYHQLGHELVHSDAILVLCSHDTRVAEYAAQLFLDRWAPLLIFSGGLGAITKHLFTEPEADRFASIAIGLGVPADRIIVENQSTNTGENVQFTRQLLAARAIDARTFILVQKPYMERRTFATFRKVWPEPSVCVTSPRVALDQYLSGYANDALSAADVISIMVGDLQRIRLYPDKGSQIPQPIPDDVWIAFRELVAAGYDPPGRASARLTRAAIVVVRRYRSEGRQRVER